MKPAVVLLLITALLIACGKDDKNPETTISVDADAQTFVKQIIASVQELDSYHLTASSPTRPSDVRTETRWEIEFARPDNYRVLLYGAEGDSRQECEPDRITGGQVCYAVLTNITKLTLFESVATASKLYYRQCEDVGKGCDAWQEHPRGPIVAIGPSPSLLPQWPIVALEMARELEIVSAEEFGGESVIHLQGHVNHLRAIFENQRRIFAAAGITRFGEECTARPGLPEECSETTFEDLLAQNELQLNFYDRNPSIVEAWTGTRGGLPHRILFSFPADSGFGKGSIAFDYSQFNQVKIKAPK